MDTDGARADGVRSDNLQTHVARARADFPRDRRIGSFIGPGGRRLWLKQVERHGLRGRVTKGSARRSFEKDRHGLRALAAAGVPAAPILAEGDDFFVTPDLGATLLCLLKDRQSTADARRAAFAATGSALARLHGRGLCHGRPSVRDTCWDGRTASFIDLERFSPRRTGPGAFTTDLLIFLWSGHSTGMDCGAELDAAAAAYLSAAPAGTAAALRRRMRHLRLLRPALAVLVWLRPASRELGAVLRTLAQAEGLLSRHAP
jgi:tRNA A-37 threonylcarbamoyl transferase component Bud32